MLNPAGRHPPQNFGLLWYIVMTSNHSTFLVYGGQDRCNYENHHRRCLWLVDRCGTWSGTGGVSCFVGISPFVKVFEKAIYHSNWFYSFLGSLCLSWFCYGTCISRFLKQRTGNYGDKNSFPPLWLIFVEKCRVSISFILFLLFLYGMLSECKMQAKETKWRVYLLRNHCATGRSWIPRGIK